MQLFQINAMNVSRDKFKLELEKNGLKYGYIPRHYEKFKQGEMTCFRLMIKDYQFVVVTDDENSYPEIQEETGNKIEAYSLEWLYELIYNTKLAGPISSEALLSELEMYLRVNKAKQCDETRKQEKCPYCHPYKEHLIEGDNGFCCVTKYAELIAFNNADEAGAVKIKIKFCPMCGRKLEELR